jgi:hypothetical protein
MGKRDGKWTYWEKDGRIKTTETYDPKKENDLAYSIYTDLETKQLVRNIQTKNLHRSWARLVGKPIASVVKPWHVACWMLFFIPIFAFLEAKTQWRGAVQAALLAFVITSILSWGFKK